MEYLNLFKQDFPFSAVADLNEYEIIRIIQDCVKNNRIYTAETKSCGYWNWKNRTMYNRKGRIILCIVNMTGQRENLLQKI